jgi:hypothetical protein
MGTSRFQIGVGITCELKDTTDQCRYGVHITISGTFRHGGLTHAEIQSRLEKAFRELDIDMTQALESKLKKEDLKDDGGKT